MVRSSTEQKQGAPPNKNKISLYNNLPKEICLKLPTMCLKSLNFVALELIF